MFCSAIKDYIPFRMRMLICSSGDILSSLMAYVKAFGNGKPLTANLSHSQSKVVRDTEEETGYHESTEYVGIRKELAITA